MAAHIECPLLAYCNVRYGWGAADSTIYSMTALVEKQPAPFSRHGIPSMKSRRSPTKGCARFLRNTADGYFGKSRPYSAATMIFSSTCICFLMSVPTRSLRLC